MLADDSALHAALSGDDGLLTGLPKGALHVSLSTIAVATADHVAALHHERGQRYVSAPVFGRPDAAAAGRLFIAAAGAAADLDEAEPVLAAIGQKVFRIGDKPSAANLVIHTPSCRLSTRTSALPLSPSLRRRQYSRSAYCERSLTAE